MKLGIPELRRKRAIAGFTLLETLVVIVIIAILFAIAAPSWDALMNRQRVNVIRDQALQIVRKAQNDARTTRVPKVVIFDPTATVPRAAILSVERNSLGQTVNNINPDNITNWQTLGNGDIKEGFVEFSTTPANGQLVFNSSGFVDSLSLNQVDPNLGRNPETATSRVFAFKVKQRNTSDATYRCVIVKTILGAVDVAEGDRCAGV